MNLVLTRRRRPRSSRWVRRLSAIVVTVMAIAATAVWLGTTTPAQAATQGGACDAFAGAKALGAAYSDAELTVPACGPAPYPSGPQYKVKPYPSASQSTDGYQCVEFSERFIYYKYGLGVPGVYTNGDQIVDHYNTKYPGKFEVRDARNKVQPVQGDVLSLSSVESFNAENGGHTAVVQSSKVDAAGNGSITIIEENSSATGTRNLNVKSWAVTGTSNKYVKWLHFKSAPTPPPSGGGGTGAGGPGGKYDLVFAIDTTGSMSPYIRSVVTAASTIVNTLDAAHADYRVGVVDYKDADFGCGDYDSVVDLPFSQDRTSILAALDALQSKVSGGCDIPEDVYSGVDKALSMPWRNGVTKSVIFMGDAPGHEPEPHSGLTRAKVAAHAFAVDPAQAYGILVGPDAEAHDFDQALADATAGRTFDATGDPSQAGAAFVEAIKAILAGAAPTTTTVKAPVVADAGAPVHLDAQVSPAPATGTVEFALDGAPLLACQARSVDGSGHAICDTVLDTAGRHALTATFSGNADLTDSTSDPATITIRGNCRSTAQLGPIVVQAGQSLCLRGATVSGGVTAVAGASVYLYGATVNGPVGAQGARTVVLCGSTVNGSIAVAGSPNGVAVGDPDRLPLCWGNTVKGALALTKNTGGVAAVGNIIGGSLAVTGNTGGFSPPRSGPVDIRSNQTTGATVVQR